MSYASGESPRSETLVRIPKIAGTYESFVVGSINRYYDPTTDQFLSIDPDVAETDQPYVFTNDDPLNASDPLGLNCGVFSIVCAAADTVTHSADKVRHAVAATADWTVKHPGDVFTAIAIATCITATAGLTCGVVSVVAIAARVTQRRMEGVPVLSSTNYLDAFITAASFGLLAVPSALGAGAAGDSSIARIVIRVHTALPDILGWFTGVTTHKRFP